MGNSQRVTRAIYPGSFDPVTKGHIDLMERAVGLFDELIVAVADSKDKRTLFTLQERIELIKETTSHVDGIQVIGFKGLLIDLAKQVNSRIVIRGLRGCVGL